MPRLQVKHIVAAQRRVQGLSVEEGAAIGDAVFASQPNLLASVVVLPRFGVSYEDLDVVLKILFVCHEAVVESGIKIPLISEADQERCLARLTGRMKFVENLNAPSVTQTVSDQVRDHPEPNLLAVAYSMLKDKELLHARTAMNKYLLLSSLNLVEVVADALHKP
jgi:hypothetical protein